MTGRWSTSSRHRKSELPRMKKCPCSSRPWRTHNTWARIFRCTLPLRKSSPNLALPKSQKRCNWRKRRTQIRVAGFPGSTDSLTGTCGFLLAADRIYTRGGALDLVEIGLQTLTRAIGAWDCNRDRRRPVVERVDVRSTQRGGSDYSKRTKKRILPTSCD